MSQGDGSSLIFPFGTNILCQKNRPNGIEEIVPQAEAVDFAYDYVMIELEKLECRL